MRNFLIVLFIFITTTAVADEKIQEGKLHTQSIHLNALLNQAELALLAANDFLTDRNLASGAVVEATLQRYVDQVDGMRAILVTDAKGNLLFDTYNKIGSQKIKGKKPLYLGDRQYFLGALESRDVKVYDPVKGRTSGAYFLPISRPVYADENLKNVVIAIMSPNKLIHNSIYDSEYSVVTMFNLSGNLIASFPHGMDIPNDFIKSLEIERSVTNSKSVPFNKNIANSIWAINKKFGLVVVYSEIQPAG